MTILPDDVRVDVASRLTPAAQQQHRTRALQRMPLHHEVVLPAYAAEHTSVFELIRHRGTEQGHGERGVDEPRIETLQALEFFLAVELVDVADAGHVEFEPLVLWQFAQAFVVAARTEEETAVHRDAIGLRSLVEGAGIRLLLGRRVRINLAPHDPGIGQHQQAVDEHFAAAIQAFGEGLDAAFALDQLRPVAEVYVCQQSPVSVVVGLPRQQRRRQRITHGTDADLQGAAVTHQSAGVQADEMVLKAHRHVWRGKQRGVVLLIDQQVKGVDAQFRIAGHVRQIVVYLADHQDGFSGGAALGDHRQ
ncbi:hypothetical protein D3C76_866430 [compost metagenome]